MSEPADAQLTALAVDGDRAAFAELYRRHERRAYNLCLRLLGSEHDAADATQEAFLSVFRRLPKLADRPLRFDAYVLTAARNASYDLLERRGRQRPTEEIVATADDSARPGDGRRSPHEDPERRVLLEAQQDEIRRANACLPERQREVLALRELGELSYDEIAEIMGLKRNAVAQLISRARINLRAALRRTALDTVAATGPDCERALALIAARADGEPGAGDDGWLDAHLDGCESCPVAREAMAEAGVSYRAWAPVVALPWLFRDTMAKAAEIVGEDWSEILEQAAGEQPPIGEQPSKGEQPPNGKKPPDRPGASSGALASRVPRLGAPPPSPRGRRRLRAARARAARRARPDARRRDAARCADRAADRGAAAAGRRAGHLAIGQRRAAGRRRPRPQPGPRRRRRSPPGRCHPTAPQRAPPIAPRPRREGARTRARATATTARSSRATRRLPRRRRHRRSSRRHRRPRATREDPGTVRPPPPPPPRRRRAARPC